jgi:diguanylate cyclase (GGDEF)-like protein/PAS domain S-box-containing protein
MSSRLRSLDDPETLRHLVHSLQEGIYITNAQGEILDANAACLEILGVPSLAELRRYRAQDLVADGGREAELSAIEREGSVREYELRIRRPDGGERTVIDTSFVVRDPATGEKLYHGILVDITRRKELERELREQSRRDPLTGCYNRRFLGELESELEVDDKLGLVILDIDNFKLYNDRHGHQAGDDVLVRFSRFLLQHVRAEDAVVRLGGDEFLVLLADHPIAATADVAERFKLEGARVAPVPFSLGWSVRKRGESLEQAIARADRKLILVRIRERSELWSRRAGRRAT